MKSRKKIIILAILFIVALGNYTRIVGENDVRTVGFLSIFALGAISALLLREIIVGLKNR